LAFAIGSQTGFPELNSMFAVMINLNECKLSNTYFVKIFDESIFM
jgi:hypothetical protein